MSCSTSAHLADRFALVIIPAGQKGPNFKGWQHTRASAEQVDRALAAGMNVGIILGPASGVIDIEYDGPQGEASFRKLCGCDPPQNGTLSLRPG